MSKTEMPEPAREYYCDHDGNEQHIAMGGMGLCDRVNMGGSLSSLASAAGLSTDDYTHNVLRDLELQAWKVGVTQGLMAQFPVIDRLIKRLEELDDDEIGLMLHELKGSKPKAA